MDNNKASLFMQRLEHVDAHYDGVAGQKPVVAIAAERHRRIYLAGPMTGYAEFNFPAFNAEAARLRATGLEVVNPAEHGIVDGAEWGDYLRYDIAQLSRCESIHFLPGWQESKGARLEHSLAASLGMRMTFADGAAPSLPAAGSAVESWRDQVQREFPNSEPEYWPYTITTPAMEREIRELRAAHRQAQRQA